MRVSKFVKLHKNILLEYIYDDNNNIGYNYQVLINNKNNVLNNSFIAGSASTTNNFLNQQLFKIDAVNNTYGIVNTSLYNFLQVKDYAEGFPIRHDTVKVHLPVNYTFGEYIGFYLRIFTFDYNNKKTYELSNFYFDVSNLDQSYLINYSNPSLLFQEKLWGKYLQLEIPSVSYLSSLRSGTTAKPNTVNYSLTDGAGLSITSPIFIDFHFINAKKTVNRTDTFTLAPKYTVSLPQSPDFQKLGLKVEHSSNGDFFEIYGTYNGNISEFNTFLINSLTLGKKYYVEYAITLFEQNIRGKSFKIVVTENFNEKVEYRPIIKFSTTTAIIDVEMNVIDEVDESSIQRRASYGMLQDEVAKYSLNLTKINLARATKPKIYNIKSPEGAGIFGNLNGSAYSDGRLYGNAGGSLFSTGTSKNLFGLSRGRSAFRNSGVGSAFINNQFGTSGGVVGSNAGGLLGVSNESGINQIADSSKTTVVLEPYPVNFTVFADRFNVLAKTDSVQYGSKSFFGIGRLRIVIQPFDQLIQFVLATDVDPTQKVTNNGNEQFAEYVSPPQYMDLSNMGEVKLVFKNSQNVVEFKLFTQTQQIDLTKGQVVFRITQNKINEIRKIYDSGINLFYITTTSSGFTTVAYSGLFTLFDNITNVNNLNGAQSDIENLVQGDTPSIINDPGAVGIETAVVTRRVIRGAGTGVGAGTQGTQGAQGGTQSGDELTNSSVPSTIPINGITYQVTSRSELKISDFTFTSANIKTALLLPSLPKKLEIRVIGSQGTLYSNSQVIGQLNPGSELITKLSTTITDPSQKNRFNALVSGQGGSPAGTQGTQGSGGQQGGTSEWKVYSSGNAVNYYISPEDASKIEVGDLIEKNGSNYEVRTVDSARREIFVVKDSAPVGGNPGVPEPLPDTTGGTGNPKSKGNA